MFSMRPLELKRVGWKQTSEYQVSLSGAEKFHLLLIGVVKKTIAPLLVT